MKKLSSGEDEGKLMAYQIAFDLYESATQAFIGRVIAHLKVIAAPFIQQTPEETAAPVATEESQDQEMKDESMEAATDVKPSRSTEVVSEEGKKHYEKLIQILSGEVYLTLLPKCALTALKLIAHIHTFFWYSRRSHSL